MRALNIKVLSVDSKSSPKIQVLTKSWENKKTEEPSLWMSWFITKKNDHLRIILCALWLCVQTWHNIDRQTLCRQQRNFTTRKWVFTLFVFHFVVVYSPVNSAVASSNSMIDWTKRDLDLYLFSVWQKPFRDSEPDPFLLTRIPFCQIDLLFLIFIRHKIFLGFLAFALIQELMYKFLAVHPMLH